MWAHPFGVWTASEDGVDDGACERIRHRRRARHPPGRRTANPRSAMWSDDDLWGADSAPILGAAFESARIHLSPEIYRLQAELRERIDLRNEVAVALGLPVTSSPETPVGLVPVGPIKAGHFRCQRLVEDGFYINPAQFPALPVRRSGGRFLLTRHQTLDDVERLVSSISRHWEASLREGGTTPEEVGRVFKIEIPEARLEKRKQAAESLHLETADSIDKLDRVEWNRMLGDRGCLGASALTVFERVFGGEPDPTRRWDFKYYIVRDEQGDAVLATCFTKALWKADMLSTPTVSRAVEARRVEDPLYLTQYVFAMGCLLSEGDHLWLRDPADSTLSRRAVQLLLEAVRRDAARLGCEMRVVRDVYTDSTQLCALLEGEGLLKMAVPDSLVLEDVGPDDDELMSRLSQRQRAHQRREVIPWNDFYEVELLGNEAAVDEATLRDLYRLYENVRVNSLELNTFSLPETLLPALLEAPDWEVTIFRPREQEGDIRRCVGFGVAYTGQSAYVPLFLGIDYDYGKSHGLYRQMLRSVVQRTRQSGKRRVLFGFGASLEKMRFGARPVKSSMFIEADDHYAFDALAQVMPGRE